MNITSLRPKLIGLIDPIGNFFVWIGLKPNQITLLSLITGVIAAILYMNNCFIVGSLFILVSGILDLVDGNVARKTNNKSKFGAVIDWIADKYTDGIILLGIGLSGTHIISQFGYNIPKIDSTIIGLAIIGSLINTFIKPVTYAEIGYTRKEKGKIIDPLESIGFFGRPETLICLMIFGFINQIWIAVLLIAICTHISILQRIVYLYQRYGSSQEI
ncbi:MAG TPA: CDP-alcohol phosphatidyltransferase family protein [Methanocorpusculum sp.]|nr:CDP-alcohol phosphatidyltransferase family protein [Methanocorpusculum sp.]